jgi:hypothetical protein
MAAITPSWVTINPSHQEPRIITQYNQASGFCQLLATGDPIPQLDTEDQYVYIKRMDLRTLMNTGPAAGNQLPSVNLALSQIRCPTYIQRVRVEYDHHDSAMAGKWGFALPEAYRLGTQQAHFQLLRDKCLYGVLPGYGEGLINTAGATALSLPADSFGADTARTYDNGQMATFLAGQILAIKSATFTLGNPRRFAILGPQRILGQFAYPNVVQLTSYQRPGAGSDTTAGMFAEILKGNGDAVEWGYDDTLIGQGTGGTDMVIISMPEVEPTHTSKIDTNKFATLAQGFNANTLMYTDMVAPMEIPTPIPGGAIDIVSEMRATPGWGVRPEALRLVSMAW